MAARPQLSGNTLRQAMNFGSPAPSDILRSIIAQRTEGGDSAAAVSPGARIVKYMRLLPLAELLRTEAPNFLVPDLD